MANESESGSISKVEPNTTVNNGNDVAAPGKSPGSSWLASLALLVAIGAVGISFWLSSQSDNKVNELERALAQFKQQTDDSVKQKLKQADVKIEKAADGFSTLQAKLQTEFNDALTGSAKEQALLKEEVQHLSDSTTAISSRIGIQSTTWIIAEAEYLLTLANYRVSLDNDVATAIAALTAADQRLKQVGDPGLLDVRREISDEINALRSVEMPDIAGMAFELAALASSAEQLPLIIKQREQNLAGSFSSTREATRQVENVSGVMNAVWKDIKSLVVVRKNDRPIDVLMAPDQRHFLFQNLILKIETGRLALLRNEPANLKISLDVAHKWLEAYFDKDTAAYANFVATLKRIQAAKLTATFPDITNSVVVLREYKEKKARESANKVSSLPKPKTKPKKEVVSKVTPAKAETPKKAGVALPQVASPTVIEPETEIVEEEKVKPKNHAKIQAEEKTEEKIELVQPEATESEALSETAIDLAQPDRNQSEQGDQPEVQQATAEIDSGASDANADVSEQSEPAGETTLEENSGLETSKEGTP